MGAIDIGELRARILRCKSTLNILHGEGFEWAYQASDGSNQRVQINGVKPLANFRDELDNFALWIWSLKDYLIDKLTDERKGFFDQLLTATRKVGELENRLLQLEPPSAEIE